MTQETNQVLIFDTTLRDGEQSPCIEFSPEQKISIADSLVQIGVNVIEAGFPKNTQDYEAVQAVAESVAGLALKHQVEPPVVCGLARAAEGDIASCWEAIKMADRPRIHTFMGSSAIHMEKKFNVTPDEALAMAVQGVQIARSYTDNVEFSPEDATRSDPGFMLEMIEAAVEHGAMTINIPDTTGIITPWEYSLLIAKTVDRAQAINPDVVVSAHCHDDLGFATANAMAAIIAGARQVHCTVNGIGERAGNTALEEVVGNIVTRSDFFDVHTTVKSELSKELGDKVAKLSGYPIPYNKAINGRNAFAHEAGIHQDGILKNLEVYQALDPAKFGRKTILVDGKHAGQSGKTAIDLTGHRDPEFHGAYVTEVCQSIKPCT